METPQTIQSGLTAQQKVYSTCAIRAREIYKVTVCGEGSASIPSCRGRLEGSCSVANPKQQDDLVNRVKAGARKNKFLAPLIIIAVIVIGLGSFTANLDNVITFYKKYFIGEPVGHWLPSADEITDLGRRALWSNEYLGSREAYSQLLDWKKSIKDPKISKLLSAEIKRVEDDYRTDIMRLHIDSWPVICKPHAVPACSKGFENAEGFSVGNVLAHLSPDRRGDERARAACILRNIRTAPDKDSIDKKELYEKLISHMSEQASSLCVSKMALETYKDLTGFSSDGVFDFEGAIKDWETRKDGILKINF